MRNGCKDVGEENAARVKSSCVLFSHETLGEASRYPPVTYDSTLRSYTCIPVCVVMHARVVHGCAYKCINRGSRGALPKQRVEAWASIRAEVTA
jgi:hypothetical protein